jgi:hypothetical protein
MVDDTATGEVKGARARFRSWSRATRILAGVVAVCTGITGIAGAVKLGAEVYQSFEKRNEARRPPSTGRRSWGCSSGTTGTAANGRRTGHR